MSPWGLTAEPLILGSLANTPIFNRVRALEPFRYTVIVAVAALLVAFGLPGTAPSPQAAYAPLAVALLVGWLLTVRLVPGRPGAALILLPCIVLFARFGLAGVPALAYASIVANLLRGLRGPGVVSTAAHAVLAYAAAALAADSASALLPSAVPTWPVFAVIFALGRFGFWHLAARWDAAPPHPRAERPELMLSLVLAPVASLPLLVGERLGDGGLLLATAAWMALLFVVREAANLATARAEMEAERDRLERANQLQDDLINLITHELRNPLTLVLSYTQMSRRATDEGAIEIARNYLSNVERGARTIQRLADNLLQISRLERPDELPVSEPLDVASLIGQVVADLAPLAKQKQQTLVVGPTQDLPIVDAVPMLLRQALSNLVSNAVKYTPEGGQVMVWAERGDQPDTVILGVRDTGIGLSEADTQRLFTKFFRSSDPRVQRERGSGLGLALTHAAVRRMGGTVSVSSRLGEGTTFTVTLPARAAA
jgi:signal transduction histidine kinase